MAVTFVVGVIHRWNPTPLILIKHFQDLLFDFYSSFGCYGNGEGEFDCLAGVAVNKIGQYIIADRYNHRIQIFDATGHFIRAFGSQGTVDGKFSYPWGITTDNLGLIYVCDKENHRVQVGTL